MAGQLSLGRRDERLLVGQGECLTVRRPSSTLPREHCTVGEPHAIPFATQAGYLRCAARQRTTYSIRRKLAAGSDDLNTNSNPSLNQIVGHMYMHKYI